MNRQERVKQTARHIRTLLTDGFELDQDTLHFLQSSFSIEDRDDFMRLLDRGFEDDLETILDLVISPDHAAMCGVEAFLSDDDFNSDDEHGLVKKVSETPLRTRINFPGDPRTIDLAVPPDVIERYIKKLNITYSIPAPVKQAMADHLPGTLSPPARVLIRRSKWAWTDDLIDFISLFFKYASQEDGNLLSDLSWAVSELSGSIPGKSIRDQLIHSVHEYQRRIGEIETLEDMLKKCAMETLMLQGVRVPSISAETLRTRTETARRILATVYAWIDGPGMAPENIDLGDFSGTDGMKKMVGLLS